MNIVLRRTSPFLFLICILIIPLGCNKPGASHSNSTEERENTVESMSKEAQYGLGQVALDFELPDLNGEMVSLSSLKGDPVVIHFATTWCPFCNAEVTYLEQLFQDYQSQGVKVLIVDVKEPEELVREKLQNKFNFSFPLLIDLDGEVANRYCPPEAQPALARDEVMIASNLLIDSEGNIQFFSLLDSEGFDAKLTELKARLDEMLASN